MRKLISVVAAAVAVACVLVWMRCRPRDDTKRADGSATRGAGTTVGGAVRAIDPRRAQHASIAGTVRDETGAPLAGAQVCADPTELRELPLCASTANNGTYTLGDLLATGYEVAASAPKFRVATYRASGERRGVVRLHAGEARTGIDFVLRAGAVELAGTVGDVTGGPIAHAVVRAGTEEHDINRRGAWSPPVIADEHGAFSLWVAPGDVRVRASAAGYAAAELDATAPDTIAIVLTPEASIDGVVIDERGMPVEGADVAADAIDIHEHARSDDRGKFHIDGLVPERYAVSARTETAYGRTGGSVLVGLASAVKDVTITMHAAYRVSGRVTIGDAPCAQPEVVLHDVAHDRQVQLAADDDGWVHGDGLQRGTYAVHPRCAGGWVRDVPAIELDRDRLGLAWTLTAGATLTGHVRGADGKPVEGASVDVRSTAANVYEDDTTARDGSYTVRGLRAATYDVTATAPTGVAKTTRALAATETATLELVLARGAKITGTVADRSGRPLHHVWISVTGDHPASAWSRRDGSFEIELPYAGDYDVVASSGEFSALEGPHPKEHVLLSAGDTADVKLVVDDRTFAITGTVTDSGGAAVADAYVAAYASSFFGTFFWSFTDHHPTLTDQDGKFRIDGLTQNQVYVVHAYRKGGGEALANNVAAGTVVKLVLPRTATIAGTLRYADGAVPDIVDVQARDRAHNAFRRDVFDHTNGAFTLDELSPGTYVVSAATPDGLGVVEATVAAGEKQTIAITLDRYVPVTGRLVDGTTPVPGVNVVASSVRAQRGSVVTPDDPNRSGPDGRFTVLAPTGETTISVSGRFQGWCAPSIKKTITGATELGDIAVTHCP